MDGDMAPLDKIADVCEEYGDMIFVDDCHGEGMLCEGRGIVAHFGLQGRVHVEGGSLSKGFGVFGGTVAGSADLIEFVKNKSRSYLLSTAHPPSVVAANDMAITVVETEPHHYKNLWTNTHYFKGKLDDLGFNTGNSSTPIIPLIIDNPGPAQEMADKPRRSIDAAREAADPCNDLSQLTPDARATRTTFKYQPRAKDPTKLCVTCNSWIPDPMGGLCGTCTMVKGPIHPKGGCGSWEEKVRT